MNQTTFGGAPGLRIYWGQTWGQHSLLRPFILAPRAPLELTPLVTFWPWLNKPKFQNGLPWEVDTWTKTCGLPLLVNFEPHPFHRDARCLPLAHPEDPRRNPGRALSSARSWRFGSRRCGEMGFGCRWCGELFWWFSCTRLHTNQTKPIPKPIPSCTSQASIPQTNPRQSLPIPCSTVPSSAGVPKLSWILFWGFLP